MSKDSPLVAIIVSIVDEKGPHPRFWYPIDFGSLAEIHNSAVKSFSIMIGDKSYRDKSLTDLTCFGLLPYPDLHSIGFIFFSGFEDIRINSPLPSERPVTITLLFQESYCDELCAKSPALYTFLKHQLSPIWDALKEHNSQSNAIIELYQEVLHFLARE